MTGDQSGRHHGSAQSATPRLIRYENGITAVDAQYVRVGLAAVHIIEHNGKAAFVDTGANHSVPYLLAALQELDLAPAAVEYVFLTHVHLDHAGGAGQLMRALPNARAVLHPRGAPHMIDPAKLIAGSMAVYGEAEFQRLYGELVPIAADRVLVTEDGQRLSLAGRVFEFLHTPGHALHHQAIVDVVSRGIFAGDTFGLSYREFDTARGPFIVPTTTPSQFDPDQLIASIDRLQSCAPEAIYLTHYGRVRDVPRLAAQLKAQIGQFVEIAHRHAGESDAYERVQADMRSLWLRLLREHGCTLPEAQIDELLGGDLGLNTQGLLSWLKRTG